MGAPFLPDQGTHRYAALDSLRGVAAGMVLLFHFYGPRGHTWNFLPVQGGWMFVDFFFVLSGFVIFASYGDRLRGGFPIGRYMVLRLGRIYPLHVAVLAAFVVFELAIMAWPGLVDRPAFSGNKQPFELVPAMLMVQVFIGQTSAWNGPAWSIAVEFWVYLITALVFAYAGRLFWPAVMLLIAAAGARLWLDEHYLVQVGHLALFRGLYGFGFGLVVFALFRKWSARPAPGFAWSTVIELALVLAGLAFVALARSGGWLTMLGPPAFSVGVFVFAYQAGAVSRVLLTAPMRWLGVLSYSIYMTHLFVLERMQDVLQALDWPPLARIGLHPDGRRFIDALPLASDLLAVVFMATVIAVSWLTYSVVERPAREWSRRVAKRTGSRSKPVAGASS